MSSSSSVEERYEDSGSEYIPDEELTDDDDSLSSASDTDSDEPAIMGDFLVVPDPFAVGFVFRFL